LALRISSDWLIGSVGSDDEPKWQEYNDTSYLCRDSKHAQREMKWLIGRRLRAARKLNGERVSQHWLAQRAGLSEQRALNRCQGFPLLLGTLLATVALPMMAAGEIQLRAMRDILAEVIVASRSRLHLPWTTRLALLASLAGNVSIAFAQLARFAIHYSDAYHPANQYPRQCQRFPLELLHQTFHAVPCQQLVLRFLQRVFHAQ